MYLYIVLFCIIASPVCAHSSYSTGLAATLQEYLDDVVHTVARNISSFSDAKLALRDTISKYSWAHPPSLTQVSKSFFNHSRYFGLEHGGLPWRGIYGTFEFPDRSQYVTKENNQMNLPTGTNINISKGASFMIPYNKNPKNVTMIPEIKGTNGIWENIPNSVTIKVNEPITIIFLRPNDIVTFNSVYPGITSPVYLLSTIFAQNSPKQLNESDALYFNKQNITLKLSPGSQITLLPNTVATFGNSTLLLFKDSDLLTLPQSVHVTSPSNATYKIRNPTYSNQSMLLSIGSSVLFDTQSIAETDKQCRMLAYEIPRPISVERGYLAQVILKQYVDTLVLKSSDAEWCQEARKADYFTGNASLVASVLQRITNPSPLVYESKIPVRASDYIMYEPGTAEYCAHVIHSKCLAIGNGAGYLVPSMSISLVLLLALL